LLVSFLVLTFVDEPAATQYECQNQDTRMDVFLTPWRRPS